jgi:hypothetical protein
MHVASFGDHYEYCMLRTYEAVIMFTVFNLTLIVQYLYQLGLNLTKIACTYSKITLFNVQNYTTVNKVYSVTANQVF